MSRFLRLFLATALITLVTLPAVAQAKKGRGQAVTKKAGTLSSISVSGPTATIVLEGGETFTVPTAKLKVVDQRGGKGKHRVGPVSTLSSGQKVIVRTVTSPRGELRIVKVKITG